MKKTNYYAKDATTSAEAWQRMRKERKHANKTTWERQGRRTHHNYFLKRTVDFSGVKREQKSEAGPEPDQSKGNEDIRAVHKSGQKLRGSDRVVGSGKSDPARPVRV